MKTKEGGKWEGVSDWEANDGILGEENWQTEISIKEEGISFV
jgi:hypothetical protein